MKAPRYIVKDPITLFLQEKEFARHTEKIQKISQKNHSKKALSLSKRDDLLKSTLFKNKLYAALFQKQETLLRIDQDNQLLLQKITEISRGNTHKTATSPGKSLNFSKRRLEATEISQENARFARRLAQPNVAFKPAETKRNIESYLKLRKHMTKMTFFPQIHKKRNSFGSLHFEEKEPQKLQKLRLNTEK